MKKNQIYYRSYTCIEMKKILLSTFSTTYKHNKTRSYTSKINYINLHNKYLCKSNKPYDLRNQIFVHIDQSK